MWIRIQSNLAAKRFYKVILIHHLKRLQRESGSETFLRESGALSNTNLSVESYQEKDSYLHVQGPQKGVYKQGVEAIGINQANTGVSSKTCKEQLRALKRIKLEVLLYQILVQDKNQWSQRVKQGCESATITCTILELC